jgi:hypothetical protein
MANKHEMTPTAMKPSGEFRETVKIGSASSWDKVTLDLFHVDFKKTDISDLRGSNFIARSYFDPPVEGEQCYNGTLFSYTANGRLF